MKYINRANSRICTLRRINKQYLAHALFLNNILRQIRFHVLGQGNKLLSSIIVHFKSQKFIVCQKIENRDVFELKQGILRQFSMNMLKSLLNSGYFRSSKKLTITSLFMSKKQNQSLLRQFFGRQGQQKVTVALHVVQATVIQLFLMLKIKQF